METRWERRVMGTSEAVMHRAFADFNLAARDLPTIEANALPRLSSFVETARCGW